MAVNNNVEVNGISPSALTTTTTITAPSMALSSSGRTTQVLVGASNGQMRVTNAGDTAPTALVSGIVIGTTAAGSSLMYETAGLRSMNYNQTANSGLFATIFGTTNYNNVNVIFGYQPGSAGETGMGFPTTASLRFTTNAIQAMVIDSSQNTAFSGNINVNGTAAFGAGATKAVIDSGGRLVPADSSTVYFEEDFVSYAGIAIDKHSVIGSAFVGYDTSTPVLDVTGASHPGVMYAQTWGAGATATIAGPQNIIMHRAAAGYTFTSIFKTPASASSAANTYVIYVGPLYNVGGNSGIYISYTHSANAGNWVCNTSTNYTNATSVAPTFDTWNTLVISVPKNSFTFTFTLNGTQLGQVTDLVYQNGGWQVPTYGATMTRASGSTILTLWLDKASVYITGLVR